MAADLRAMTDTELDQRLTRLYRQHAGAIAEQRIGWHGLIVDVLTEQQARRDAWLAEGPALSRG